MLRGAAKFGGRIFKFASLPLRYWGGSVFYCRAKRLFIDYAVARIYFRSAPNNPHDSSAPFLSAALISGRVGAPQKKTKRCYRNLGLSLPGPTRLFRFASLLRYRSALTVVRQFRVWCGVSVCWGLLRFASAVAPFLSACCWFVTPVPPRGAVLMFRSPLPAGPSVRSLLWFVAPSLRGLVCWR